MAPWVMTKEGVMIYEVLEFIFTILLYVMVVYDK